MAWLMRRGFLLAFCAVLLIGNVVFYFLWQQSAQKMKNNAALVKHYPLLSSRAVLGSKNDITVSFLPLRNQIHNEVDPISDTFAIYFEYLPTGTAIGINEDSEFTAASLLKVPVVMAYYAKKERLNMMSDPTVQIKKSELNSKFGTLYKEGAGATINLGDAARIAITESDNTASFILADQISDNDFKTVYEGLDIPQTLKGDSPIITAIQYVSILKALYYSSVLNVDDSEKILSYMTKTDFSDMLPAGVPRSVPIAHKIGLIDKEIYQDCGIVYVPDRPYVLCMISKSDRATAKARMQNISKTVYNFVASNQN